MTLVSRLIQGHMIGFKDGQYENFLKYMDILMLITFQLGSNIKTLLILQIRSLKINF